MKITHDHSATYNKYTYVSFTQRAQPDVAVVKLIDTDDDGGLFWLPATVRVQPTELEQPDAYVLIAALQLALAEAVKMDAQWPVGSEAT